MTGRVIAAADVRVRWRMGPEARALTVLTAVLVVFGLAVLYSASALAAMREGHAHTFYLFRQLTGVMVGLVIFAAVAKVDAERWRTWAWPAMVITLLLLLVIILPFTTGIAPRINGSRRWLNLGVTVQPSEVAKFTLVIWTAMLIVKKGERMRRLTKGLLPFLVVLAALNVLVLLEPDLSQALMYTLVMGIMLFVGGVRMGHVILLSALAIPVVWSEVERLQYRMLRVTAFLDPGSAPQEASYQLKQSLIAVGSGRWLGVGFGQGRQQDGFLPYPYNDFIGSNIGEEWGFLGLIGVTLAFTLYLWLGFRIARMARSPFLQLTAVGLTLMTVITAFLHLGVVIGLLPTTGLTLPFFSYGRTYLVVSLLMTGILVNIGSRRERVYDERGAQPLAAAPA